MLTILFVSCTSIGPGRITKDQFDYNTSVGRGLQAQLLLNFVKMRYGDTPVFLEVTSIVNQYELESELGLTLINGVPNSQRLGATGTYTDKPTISYAPIKGEAFTRSLLTPIPTETIFSLIQAGWSADVVLEMAVRSINGVSNTVGGYTINRQSEKQFQSLTGALRRIQLAGGVGLKVKKQDEQNLSLITFKTAHTNEVEDDILFVRNLLEIDPSLQEIPLVFGSVRQSDQEMAMLTRSMLDIMSALAAYIMVPEIHAVEGRASGNLPADAYRLIRVHNSKEPPDDAFVAVPYHDYWFWIADTDLESKHMLSVMVLLFSLVQTGNVSPVAPVLTIPAG